jgi:outer membrane protein TolC
MIVTHRTTGLFLVAVFLLPLETTFAQKGLFETDTVTVSLTEAIGRAIDISPEMSASRSATKKAEALRSFAKANRFLTEFELSSGFATAPGISNPNNTPNDQLYLDPDVRNDWDNWGVFSTVGIRALQPVFTWGKISGSVRAAGYGVEIEEEGIRATSQNVALRSAELY